MFSGLFFRVRWLFLGAVAKHVEEEIETLGGAISMTVVSAAMLSVTVYAATVVSSPLAAGSLLFMSAMLVGIFAVQAGGLLVYYRYRFGMSPKEWADKEVL